MTLDVSGLEWPVLQPIAACGWSSGNFVAALMLIGASEIVNALI